MLLKEKYAMVSGRGVKPHLVAQLHDVARLDAHKETCRVHLPDGTKLAYGWS
jgi:hypothetical protein